VAGTISFDRSQPLAREAAPTHFDDHFNPSNDTEPGDGNAALFESPPPQRQRGRLHR